MEKKRKCKRCKTQQAEHGSKICAKCNERNNRHTVKEIAEMFPTKPQSTEFEDAYGGLGSELESGHMNYDAYHFD